MNLGYLFRNVTSSCFTKQHSYSYRMLLLFSTQETTPTPSSRYISTRKPVTVYLIERLGFTEEQSLTISNRLLRRRDYPNVKQVTDKISFEKSDNVITYLQEYCGLDLSHIKKAVSKYPLILGTNVDKTLRPKIKLLQDLGFSTSDLAQVLSRNPFLYLDCDLSPAIQALRGFLGKDEDVVRVLKGLNWGPSPTVAKNVIPNVTMLGNEYGIPRDKLIKFLTKSPRSLLRITESLRDVLVRIEDKWGISRDSSEFLKAVHVFSGFTDESINAKCQVFRSYGWSDSDILTMIRRHPYCVGLSEARIKKKLDFYMNELGYEPAYVASRPVMISLSLENRVVPRHRVLTILKEKGLIRVDYKLYTAISVTENVFLNNFIIPYESIVPNLRQVLVNSKAPCEAMLGGKTSEDEDEAHQ